MMKKLISLALTLAMLCCMATTAYAATDKLIGYEGDDRVGVGTFSDAGADTKVEIKVGTGDITHKYAVDVVYEDVLLSISGGNLTWNVNTLQYDVGAGTGLETTVKDFEVVNYSDLPVYLSTVVDDVYDDDGIKIETSVTGKETVAASGVGVGNETHHPFTLTIDLEDGKTWNDVVNYYTPMLNANGNAEILAGTVTIKISKNA